jgi:hypothetical protein
VSAYSLAGVPGSSAVRYAAEARSLSSFAAYISALGHEQTRPIDGDSQRLS